MMRPVRRHMFWRIFRHNLGLIIAVAIFLAVFFRQFKEQAPWHRTPVNVAAWLAQQPAEALPAEVARIAELIAVDLAVYTHDGTALAQAGAEPPEAESCGLDELSRTEGDFRGRHLVAVALDDERYMLLRWSGRDHRIFFVGLAGLLVLLSVFSWFRARSVAQPMEAITAAAVRLGQGDLTARVGRIKKRFPDIARIAGAIDDMANHVHHLRENERALLAAVSHELRTPLARIRVALEWAAEEGELPLPLDGVEGDLAELEGLIEDLLASVRLQTAGAFPVDRAPADLAELVTSEVARFEKQHPGREVTVAMGPQSRDVDARLLRRVVSNLLSNAARYTDGPVRIEGGTQGDDYVVSVLDRGPGLSAEDRARVFDPFFRADASRTRATGGVGMGLTLCKRIVDAHGGWIRADARGGGGLAVRFGLPADGELPGVAVDPTRSS